MHIGTLLLLFTIGLKFLIHGHTHPLGLHLLELFFTLLWWRLLSVLDYRIRKRRIARRRRGSPPPRPPHLRVSFFHYFFSLECWIGILTFFIAPLEYNRYLWFRFLWETEPTMAPDWVYRAPPLFMPNGEGQFDYSQSNHSDTFVRPVSRPVKLVSPHFFGKALMLFSSCSLLFPGSISTSTIYLQFLTFDRAGRNGLVKTRYFTSARSLRSLV